MDVEAATQSNQPADRSRQPPRGSSTSLSLAQETARLLAQKEYEQAVHQWVGAICAKVYSPRSLSRKLAELRAMLAQTDISPEEFETHFLTALGQEAQTKEQRLLMEALFFEGFDDFERALPAIHRWTEKQPQLKRRLQKAIDLSMWVPGSATIHLAIAELLIQLGNGEQAASVLEPVVRHAGLEAQVAHAQSLLAQLGSRSDN